MSLEYLASGEEQFRLEPVLVQNSGLNFCVGSTRWMDGYTKEVLDSYREEDAGDLRKSELNELIESMTCLHALNGKMKNS